MDFHILGPLDVLDDGRSLALAGSKPRALLALLFERDQAKRRRTMSRWLR